MFASDLVELNVTLPNLKLSFMTFTSLALQPYPFSLTTDPKRMDTKKVCFITYSRLSN